MDGLKDDTAPDALDKPAFWEYQYPELSDKIQLLKLKRHNNLWKFTTCLSSVIAVLAIVVASIVVSSSHNPTFMNDLLLTTFVGHWSALPSHIFSPFGRNYHDMSLPVTSKLITVETLNKGQPVVPIHSHNDYWRRAPFFEAVSLGCQGIEADVWHLKNRENDLYVGHHKRSLSSFKTLHNMYIEPLETLLDSVNAHDVLVDDGDVKKLGVFDTDPTATLYFVLDVKNSPDEVFELIEQLFSRFYQKGYLTTYDTTTHELKEGPVTLVISGNVPLEKISAQKIRTMFVDAPLDQLAETQDLYNNRTGMAIFSSTSLKKLTGSKASRYSGGLNKRETAHVLEALELAHSLGLKTRVWDTPAWPTAQRDKVWRDLLDLGVDLVNSDDLAAAMML